MANKINSRNDSQKKSIWTLIFIGYLAVAICFPSLKVGILSFLLYLFFQLVICGLLFQHWYSRIDYSKSYTGPKSKVLSEIDKSQFTHTNFLSLGFKSKEPYASGYFEQEKVSNIFAERYDLLMLIVALLGEFLVYLAAYEHLNVRRGFLASLWRDSEYAKNIISGLGSYIFLWGFSLFILGLVSRFIDMKGKK
jgi:hypothetical protein